MIKDMYSLGRSVYRSLNLFRKTGKEGLDEETRHPEYARELMNRVGVSEEGMDVWVVSGSKGKSSVSRVMDPLLRGQGKKVGLFTGPHLVKFNERIQVDGSWISDEDFIRIGKRVDKEAKQLEKEIPEGTYIGPRGILLTIAMVYFKEKGIDIGIFEVGLGGLYDDVSVLHNEGVVVTSVLRENLDRVGPELKDVVAHKIGVVRNKETKVIVGKQPLESMVWIKKALKMLEIDGTVYGKDFRVRNVKGYEEGVRGDIETVRNRYEALDISLVGEYQVENVGLAIQAVEKLTEKVLKEEEVKEALRKVDDEGRCEVLDYGPLVVVDGAVHRTSAKYVREWIERLGDFDCISVIVSVPKDKDYQGVMEECKVFAGRMVYTQAKYCVREYPSVEEIGQVDEDCKVEVEFEKALSVANEIKPDVIVVVGTAHIVGEAKRYWA